MVSDPADALADLVLLDHEGSEVRLGDLWSKRPVALVWLRHYGWLHCRDHAVQLHRAREEFQATGGDLVLIGQASPRQAAHFRRRWTPELPVLADAERASYRAAGAGRMNVTDALNPLLAAKSLRATMRSGAVQGRVIGDAAQLGGAMVVRPDGSVAWSKMASDVTDNASADEILGALRAAAARNRRR